MAVADIKPLNPSPSTDEDPMGGRPHPGPPPGATDQITRTTAARPGDAPLHRGPTTGRGRATAYAPPDGVDRATKTAGALCAVVGPDALGESGPAASAWVLGVAPLWPGGGPTIGSRISRPHLIGRGPPAGATPTSRRGGVGVASLARSKNTGPSSARQRITRACVPA